MRLKRILRQGGLFHMVRLRVSWPTLASAHQPLGVASRRQLVSFGCIQLCFWRSCNPHFLSFPALSCCCYFPELIWHLVPSKWQTLYFPFLASPSFANRVLSCIAYPLTFLGCWKWFWPLVLYQMYRCRAGKDARGEKVEEQPRIQVGLMKHKCIFVSINFFLTI